MTIDRYWCELALIGDRVEAAVAIDVDAGRFTRVEVGTSTPPDAIRLAGVTLPGLANAHSHAFHRALRSRTQADGGSFWSWRDQMYKAAGRLDPDNYHRLSRAAFAEMVLAGVTSVGEFHYVHHAPDGTPYADPNAMGEAVLQAARDAGIRITLLDTLYLHGGLGRDGYEPVADAQRRFGDASVDRWCERVEALRADDSQRIGAAVHSVRAVDPDAMAVVATWAAEHDALVHVHASEQRAEHDVCQAALGSSPIGVLAGSGVLTDRCSVVHATHATESDIVRLAGSGASVVMCPTTERDLGDGIGPTAGLVAAGVPVALGSDSHAVIDLFEEARAVELDERLRAERRGVHRALDLLAAATAVGQRTLGWHDAGRLAVGDRADLVTVALDSVRTAGSGPETTLEAVVFAATAADVTQVIVDGRPVVRDGHHLELDVAVELAAAITELMDHD